MYAVIQSGGHQYKVKQGDQIRVDFINGKEGDAVTFDKVMLLAGDKTTVGAPLVAGAKVAGVIKEQTRDPKIIVFKFRRRKNSKRTRGHKQPITVVEIGKITH